MHNTCFKDYETTETLAKIDEINRLQSQLRTAEIEVGLILRTHWKEFHRHNQNDRVNFESLCKHTLGIPSMYMSDVYHYMKVAWESKKKPAREDFDE